jgi:hypothetical protein
MGMENKAKTQTLETAACSEKLACEQSLITLRVFVYEDRAVQAAVGSGQIGGKARWKSEIGDCSSLRKEP